METVATYNGGTFQCDHSGSSLEKKELINLMSFGCDEPNTKKVWVVSLEGAGHGCSAAMNQGCQGLRGDPILWRLGGSMAETGAPSGQLRVLKCLGS